MINSIGAPKIIIKTDQEPAIIDVQREVRKQLWDEVIRIAEEVRDLRGESNSGPRQVILENSPVGESQSNGFIENRITEIQQQIRKLRDQVEQNLACSVLGNSPIWPWLAQYAAQVIHTFKVYNDDNRTARQRLRADPTVPPVPKFGERVFFKPSKTVHIPKDENR